MFKRIKCRKHVFLLHFNNNITFIKITLRILEKKLRVPEEL